MNTLINLEDYNESILLEDMGDMQLWQLGPDRLEAFNNLIYRVYNETRSKDGSESISRAEVLAGTETFYSRSKLCAVTTADGRLLGTWGTVFKSLEQPEDTFQLPIERQFGINLLETASELGLSPRVAFNGWRTCIDKDLLEELGYGKSKSVLIFDLLIRGLMGGFRSNFSQFMGVAEMEALVMRYHRQIGVPWQKIGAPKTYNGSAKIPAAFSPVEYVNALKTNHPERYQLVFGQDLGVQEASA